ncbi:bifunctional proline dehydrogenase/L-glutamate gamma-semialdehyde dehydrogenase PutA [Litoreibacter arenae]|uniref:Bifunctional protein PutA n=1 Tax=Litoreibacter arenae DSM 19593 TaxID=1123360 RepID=S9S3R9_9RHOB|nr:bifunctional proline dehydrogenase/L-glutamate gamma-semialdehyde dehydrogenase PutA [Litoreibacter arenae]EPX80819.1 Proline dehydrogenase (Proline oxidase) / Delta-1-pyrroline-5-carboxylate dehydrogenase [Litoreibacter arenae DSM 19593]
MTRETAIDLREEMRAHMLPNERDVLDQLIATANLSAEDRQRIADAGAALVKQIRSSAKPGLMEVFLAEYGLSTDEGVALMCLAEALLRVPDADTMDALIEDKIAPSDWGRHLGHSASSLVNASTWALMLTGKVLEEESRGIAGQVRGMVKRLGEPVIRTAVARAMKEMGRQFVLGETIAKAMSRAENREGEGYTYSYDMLGEAARTDADARGYFDAYRNAIDAITKAATHGDIRSNPGISVKLSALYPRYESPHKGGVMDVLVPRLSQLCHMAAEGGVGLNIDAEEADRLDLSLDVIEAALSDDTLKGWDGFGVVVQAYGPRASFVIDWLYALASRLDRRIMVRLVKGAYWDTEIKRAQVMGLSGFPVFTHKQATDVSYIANARKLLGLTDRIYPQFATHNAHTVAAILDMATDYDAFEFQRLHGMGERLHDIVLRREKTRCRIYAPVGAHRDLLAYLVRRLLENGANSSFVNQIVDEDVPASKVASDPFAELEGLSFPAVTLPANIFPGRKNSQGWDWTDPRDMGAIDAVRDKFRDGQTEVAPLIVSAKSGTDQRKLHAPATPDDHVGTVHLASTEDAAAAVKAAQPWSATASERSKVLLKAADLYEANIGPIFALLAREAGKTMPDCIGEVREAVDFLRYYAGEAGKLTGAPRGRFVCISPWNFPLAIFTGQIAAALAAGNAVLAKPAEQTPLIAHLATSLLHEAGVPLASLQLLPGGGEVGAALTAQPDVDGVCFTGSTATAMRVHRSLAEDGNATAPLIAETGGLNAMIVDSTALPEQATRDIVASAFQSAGQRCSALRCLYVQEDVAEGLIEMIKGAMDALNVGDPWHVSTDVGPIIDAAARDKIAAYIDIARAEGRVIHELQTPKSGTFIAPTMLRVDSIAQMKEEIFGPVLHVATFKSHQLEQVIDQINATGYGLTFGLHSRIDDRVQEVVDRVHAGNIYVNRNQIGAVVGSQPFGGEGLSGTGPKAGGPLYLTKFTQSNGAPVMPEVQDMPGPTGETNRLSTHSRAPFLCLGPDPAAQIAAVQAAGGTAREGMIEEVATTPDISGVLWFGDADTARRIRQDLASRDGPILQLITEAPRPCDTLAERHVCIDTTASGGNAALLAEVGA